MVLIDGFQGRVLSTKAVNVSDFYDFMVLLPYQRYHKPDISLDVEKRKHFMKLHIHLAMFLLLKYSSRSFEANNSKSELVVLQLMVGCFSGTVL
ncbi:unnamed protein product [Musa hybrid cultivar]